MKLEKEVKEIEQGRCHMFLHLLVARYDQNFVIESSST